MGLVKPPRPSSLTAVGVLVVLLATAAVLPQSLLTGLIETGLLGLLVAEVDRSGRYLALRIVGLAARPVPQGQRAALADEWRDHVLAAGEHGLRPLIASVSVVRAAVAIVFHYRVRIYIAVRLLQAFGSCFVVYAELIVAMTKRRVPFAIAGSIAVVAATWTAPLHLARPSSRSQPMWLRLVLGAVASLCVYVVFLALLHALVPSLVLRLTAQVVACGCLGLGSRSLIMDLDAVTRAAGWVGGKPMRDIITATEAAVLYLSSQ
jgi:hypothetical protein